MASKKTSSPIFEGIMSNEVLRITSLVGIVLAVVANMSVTNGDYSTYLGSTVAYLVVAGFAFGLFKGRTLLLVISIVWGMSSLLQVLSQPLALIDVVYWVIVFLSQIPKQKPSK